MVVLNTQKALTDCLLINSDKRGTMTQLTRFGTVDPTCIDDKIQLIEVTLCNCL